MGFPYNPDQKWGVTQRPKPSKEPREAEKVNYAIRRRFDGEVQRSDVDLQPEIKDSTERMQDMAEEPEESESKVDKSHNVGSTIPFPISNARSMFEGDHGIEGHIVWGPTARETAIWVYLVSNHKGQVHCSSHRLSPEPVERTCENSHDVIMYSTTTSVYTAQQVLVWPAHEGSLSVAWQAETEDHR